MAFWDRDKGIKAMDDLLATWKEAKQISPEVGRQPEILAPGWYFYKEHYLWHGLRPNEDGTNLQNGFDFQTLSELENWLGLPVPQSLLTQEQNRETPSQQVTKIHLPMPAAPAVEALQKPEPQGRARRRDSNIHIKVTPQEHELFKARVAQSGMTMTNYILRCTLQDNALPPVNTQSIVESIESLQKQLLDLMAEVGRQGGMLKMVIRPNEGQRTLRPEEWDALIQATQDQNRIKRKIEKTLEVINGYFETLHL